MTQTSQIEKKAEGESTLKTVPVQKSSELEKNLELIGLGEAYRKIMKDEDYRKILAPYVEEYTRGKSSFDKLEGAIIVLAGIQAKNIYSKDRMILFITSESHAKNLMDEFEKETIAINGKRTSFLEYVGMSFMALADKVEEETSRLKPKLADKKAKELEAFTNDFIATLGNRLLEGVKGGEEPTFHEISSQVEDNLKKGNLFGLFMAASRTSYDIARNERYTYSSEKFARLERELTDFMSPDKLLGEIESTGKTYNEDFGEYIHDETHRVKSLPFLRFISWHTADIRASALWDATLASSLALWFDPTEKDTNADLQKRKEQVITDKLVSFAVMKTTRGGKDQETLKTQNYITFALANMNGVVVPLRTKNEKEYRNLVLGLHLDRSLDEKEPEEIAGIVYERLLASAKKVFNIKSGEEMEQLILGFDLDALRADPKAKGRLDGLKGAKKELFGDDKINAVEEMGKKGTLPLNKDSEAYKTLSTKGYSDRSISIMLYGALPYFADAYRRYGKDFGKFVGDALAQTMQSEEGAIPIVMDREKLQQSLEKKAKLRNIDVQEVLGEYGAGMVIDALRAAHRRRRAAAEERKKAVEAEAETYPLTIKETVKKRQEVVVEPEKATGLAVDPKTGQFMLTEEHINPYLYGFAYRGEDPNRWYCGPTSHYVQQEAEALKRRKYTEKVGGKDYELNRVIEYIGKGRAGEADIRRIGKMYDYIVGKSWEELEKYMDPIMYRDLRAASFHIASLKAPKADKVKLDALAKRTFAQYYATFYEEHTMLLPNGAGPKEFLAKLTGVQQNRIKETIAVQDVEKIAKSTRLRDGGYELWYVNENNQREKLGKIEVQKGKKPSVSLEGGKTGATLENVALGSVIYLKDSKGGIAAQMDAMYWMERKANGRYRLFELPPKGKNVKKGSDREAIEVTIDNVTDKYFGNFTGINYIMPPKKETREVEEVVEKPVPARKPPTAAKVEVPEEDEELGGQPIRGKPHLVTPLLPPNIFPYVYKPKTETIEIKTTTVTPIGSTVGSEGGEISLYFFTDLYQRLGYANTGYDADSIVNTTTAYIGDKIFKDPALVSQIDALQAGNSLTYYGLNNGTVTNQKPADTNDYFRIDITNPGGGSNLGIRTYYDEHTDIWVETTAKIEHGTVTTTTTKFSVPVGGVTVENLADADLGPLHLNALARAVFVYGEYSKEGKVLPDKVKTGDIIPSVVGTVSTDLRSLGIDLPAGINISAYYRAGQEFGATSRFLQDYGVTATKELSRHFDATVFYNWMFGPGAALRYKNGRFEMIAGMGFKEVGTTVGVPGNWRYPAWVQATYDGWGARASLPFFVDAVLNGKPFVGSIVGDATDYAVVYPATQLAHITKLKPRPISLE